MTLQVMLEDGYMYISHVDWYAVLLVISGLAALYFWYRVITKAIFEEYIECSIRRAIRAENFL